MESVVGNRFQKMGSESVRVFREQDALLRCIVIGDQLTGLRFLDQFDSFTAGRDRFAVLVGLVDEA